MGGEVPERLKGPVLKTGVASATVGSNPTLSAIPRRCQTLPAAFRVEWGRDSSDRARRPAEARPSDGAANPFSRPAMPVQ